MKKVIVVILMLLLVLPVRAQQADTLSTEMKAMYFEKYDEYMAKAKRRLYPGFGLTVPGVILTGLGISAVNTAVYDPASRSSAPPKYGPYLLGFGLLCAVSGMIFLIMGSDQFNNARMILTSHGIAIPIKHKQKANRHLTDNR